MSKKTSIISAKRAAISAHSALAIIVLPISTAQAAPKQQTSRIETTTTKTTTYNFEMKRNGSIPSAFLRTLIAGYDVFFRENQRFFVKTEADMFANLVTSATGKQLFTRTILHPKNDTFKFYCLA